MVRLTWGINNITKTVKTLRSVELYLDTRCKRALHEVCQRWRTQQTKNRFSSFCIEYFPLIAALYQRGSETREWNFHHHFIKLAKTYFAWIIAEEKEQEKKNRIIHVWHGWRYRRLRRIGCCKSISLKIPCNKSSIYYREFLSKIQSLNDEIVMQAIVLNGFPVEGRYGAREREHVKSVEKAQAQHNAYRQIKVNLVFVRTLAQGSRTRWNNGKL